MPSTTEEAVEHTKQFDKRMREIKRQSLRLHAQLTELAELAWLLANEYDDTATRH